MNFSSEDEKILRQGLAKAVIRRMIQQWVYSPKALRLLVAALTRPVIGTKHICNQPDHCSQLTFVWDVIAGYVNNYILWANRSGSKTYFAALITWLMSSHYEMLETNILGGSENQSSKAYDAIRDFWQLSNLDSELLQGAMLSTQSKWKNGSKVSILTASSKSVRGPHPQCLVLDEVDEMDFDIYEAAISQPQTKHGIPAQIGIYSTNHNESGTMDKVLQSIREGGYSLYKYCIWECIMPCTDYSCSTCKLSTICPGEQVKEADGYYQIEDFVAKLKTLSMDSVMREWLCIKTGAGNLVYQKEYDESIHIVDVPVAKSKPVFLSIDWGGVNPFSVGVWQYFEDMGWARVDEVVMANSTNQRLLAECKDKDWWNRIEGGVADPARNDLITEWADEGIFLDNAFNPVEEGIEKVKGALRPVIGDPKIFINKTCKHARKEFVSYKTKDGKIVKKFDHCMDEIRYFVCRYVIDEEGATAAGGTDAYPQ